MTIAGYEILQWRQHWSLIAGSWYRDALARRLSDGALRLVSVLDES